MKSIGIAISAALVAVLLVATPSHSSEANLVRIQFGDSTVLSAAQELELESELPVSGETGKFICSGLYLEGAGLSDRLLARTQAKSTCEYLSSKFGMENWYQAKPTSAANFVGSVYARFKVQDIDSAASDEASQGSNAVTESATISKTTTLPQSDYSTDVASAEIVALAIERASSSDSPDEIVCTSVVSESANESNRQNALSQAAMVCEAVALATGHAVRHQVKVSSSSWKGRVMLTSIWSPRPTPSSTVDEDDETTEARETASESNEAGPQVPASSRPPLPRPGSQAGSQNRVPAPSAPTPPAEDPINSGAEEIEEPEPTPIAEVPEISLSIAGNAISGETVTASLLNVPVDAEISCSWHDNATGAARQFFGSECSVVVPTNKGLYVDVSVLSSGERVFEATSREVCSLCIRTMINTPTFGIVGDPYVGETMTVDVGTIDSGATVQCSWESRGSYNNTIFSRSCSFTPSNRMGAFYVRAIVSKAGLPSWSSGWVLVSGVTLRPMTPAPTAQIVGDMSPGQVITGSVANVPEGASVSCSWYNNPSGGSPVYYGSSCDILITLAVALAANGPGLYLRVSVTKANYETWATTIKVGTISSPNLNPTVQVIGEFVVGSTVEVVVSDIPEGSEVRCTWWRMNPRGSNVSRAEYSTTCSLEITEAVKASVNVSDTSRRLHVSIVIARSLIWNAWSASRGPWSIG